jgi:hypothetical protein
MTVAISGWNGPGKSFVINDAVAYVDTITILVEFPPPSGLLSKLRRMARNRMKADDAMRPDRANPDIQHPYGKIIALAQPTEQEIRLILAMCVDGYLTIRGDVACDFHPSSREEAVSCGEYLSQHGRQKWRGKKRSYNRTENVTYWSADAATTRNIAVYYDKPSRKNGEPCAHWEMRFMSADACRRAGLDDLNKLLEGIDVFRLLNHQSELRALDKRRFFKLTENTARRMKLSHRHALENRTVAQVQNRIHGMIFAALQNEHFTPDEATIDDVAVQEIHDRAPLARKALVEARKWEEFTPKPRWLR